MGRYESKNAENVLENVERLLKDIEEHKRYRYDIREVCKELSIFDWWNDYLSATKLKDMRKFLKVAIKRGYTGFACFKVGAAGCANGMWAYKEETQDGFSPDGEFLYKSFTPEYNCWSVKAADGAIYPARGVENRCKTINELDAILSSLDEVVREEARS